MSKLTVRALYDRLENENHHGLTALLTALVEEDYDAVVRLGEIIRAHQEIGHMPMDLLRERLEISNPLYKSAIARGDL